MKVVDFFLQPIWNPSKLAQFSREAHQIIASTQKLLAEYHQLPLQQVQYISYESLYQVTSTMFDCNQRVEGLEEKGQESTLIDPLSFFQNNANRSLNNDLEYRLSLFHNMANAAQKSCDLKPAQQLERASIEEYLGQKQLQILEHPPRQFWSKLLHALAILKAKLFNFIITTKKIHYLQLDTRMWSQVAGAKWIKLDYQAPLTATTAVEKYDFFESIKDLFFQMPSLSQWNPLEKKLLLITLINHLPASMIKVELHKKLLLEAQNTLIDSQVETLISQGQFFRDDYKYLFIAAKESNLRLIEIQNGGFPIYDEGDEIIQNRFTLPREYLTWAPEHKLPTPIKKTSFPNPRFHSITPLKIRANKPIKILYTPIALSHLFNCELFCSFLPEHMKAHRELIHQSLQSISNINISLNVKLKAFGNTLWKGYEYFTIPKLDGLNFPLNIRTIGTSSMHFSDHHLHLTDGMSTTFSESLAQQMPTIGIWNQQVLVCHKNFQEIYARLKKCKILISEPDELRDALALYQENPNYWNTPEVQSVVLDYCSALAYHSPHWIKEIKGIIQ